MTVVRRAAADKTIAWFRPEKTDAGRPQRKRREKRRRQPSIFCQNPSHRARLAVSAGRWWSWPAGRWSSRRFCSRWRRWRPWRPEGTSCTRTTRRPRSPAAPTTSCWYGVPPVCHLASDAVDFSLAGAMLARVWAREFRIGCFWG